MQTLITSFVLYKNLQKLPRYRRNQAYFQFCTRASMQGSNSSVSMKFIDIGANLLDGMYQGRYHGNQYHAPDLDKVLERSWQAGVEKMIITAGNLQEAKDALELAKTDDRLFCTVGVHPTRCGEFESAESAEEYLNELKNVIKQGMEIGKVVAVGECGLDYDRLFFCEAEIQRKWFAKQFELAKESGLPMFLHLRAATDDFVNIVKEHRNDFISGVVHSFTGSIEELNALLENFDNLSIGINGCSLKTEENLQVVAAIPLEKLMIETDCPWCEIKNSHASKKYVTSNFEAKDKKKYAEEFLVKGRSEPCNIRQVVEVIAGVRQIEDMAVMAEQIYQNTRRVFFGNNTAQLENGRKDAADVQREVII
eukprot:TRINITY_DN7174_c0_g1_i1.p1 TRINITY_DN7174_c0_g1~~TRINITY_DN7174_c0_g1_i1.p1  ORF type:complete len:366 (+),score=47.49 TRINITY_DN7174_c0_g1_i1:61-1158(+)